MTPVDAPRPVTPRPFYGEVAWAYDHLVDRLVAAECAGIAATLARRGIGPGAALLDAGCGTGRYAVEVARRGFAVTGVDRSAALLAEARARPVGGAGRVRFEQGELLALPGDSGYDAIVCRGVLDDFVDRGLRAAGFETIQYSRAYEGAPAGAGDRIVVAASLDRR